MSLTAQIGSTESSFKLSQKIVSALAEKFSFKFEDGWSVISTRTLENIQKRLKRDKRRANPTSSIKHPRTAFSFFTQKQRPVSQAAHPQASFGDLSRFVSEAWKALTPEQMAEFKALETADKERYQVERTSVLAALAAAPASTEAVAEVAEPVKEKKVRKAKSAEAAPVATEVVAPVTAAPAKKAKSAKAEVAVPVAASPAETAAPAKKAKTPKAAAPAEVVVAAEAAPVAEAAPKAAKAPKAKAVKA